VRQAEMYAQAWHGIQQTEKACRMQGKGLPLGGSVATGLLLVLTADSKARNAPRFASPSERDANESTSPFQ
jgi:hypothetical protein